MRATQFHLRDILFGGIFGVISDALTRRYDPVVSPANSAAVDRSTPAGTLAAEVESGTANPGEVAGRLDRWFWRQRMNKTESWLAQSRDVFELEERIRRLERTVGPCYFSRQSRQRAAVTPWTRYRLDGVTIGRSKGPHAVAQMFPPLPFVRGACGGTAPPIRAGEPFRGAARSGRWRGYPVIISVFSPPVRPHPQAVGTRTRPRSRQ